jgi:hypothetical protein
MVAAFVIGRSTNVNMLHIVRFDRRIGLGYPGITVDEMMASIY